MGKEEIEYRERQTRKVIDVCPKCGGRNWKDEKGWDLEDNYHCHHCEELIDRCPFCGELTVSTFHCDNCGEDINSPDHEELDDE